VLVAVLVAAGTPLWGGANTRLVERPTWKRSPRDLALAGALLPHTRPGDLILAPRPLSQTLLIASAAVTTISPRRFYTSALEGARGAHPRKRLRLQRFAADGLGPRQRPLAILRALRVLGVDVACVRELHVSSPQLLAGARYRFLLRSHGIWCARHSPRTTEG
jgi:hypothetical protein